MISLGERPLADTECSFPGSVDGAEKDTPRIIAVPAG